MILLRQHIGGSLRERRLQQGRTLRQVSADAKVSLVFGETQMPRPGH